MPHSTSYLLEIMSRLRDPKCGCPWDLEQNFQTLVKHVIEEAYEVVDAVELQDDQELQQELGDLLLQVVFYAQIAKEEGRFTYEDVVQGLCDKLVARHEHVFSDTQVASAKEQEALWEQQKEKERKQKNKKNNSVLSDIAKALPSIIRAEKLQKRASQVGFDWPDVTGAFAKFDEEYEELKQAVASANERHIEEEIGDMLFSLVNIARKLGHDGEACLRKGNDKFTTRFQAIEALLEQQGRSLKEVSLEEMESLWQQVKQKVA